MSQNKYKLLYKFQATNENDHIFKAEKHPKISHLEISTINVPYKNSVTQKTNKISPSTFLVKNIGNILDQGDLGDCVANAFAFSINTQTQKKVNISRLFLYDICRILDNTPLNQDNGTTVRTACTTLKKYGSINEQLLPYNTSNFSVFPSINNLKNSKFFNSFSYSFLNQDLQSLKNCLSNYQVPIVFGFMVYDSFMTDQVANTGVVPMPDTVNENLQGGHCMNIIGYNDTTQLFTCVNSWGTSWGKNGLCYMPYAYMLDPNLASDLCFTQFVY
jgi:C1A family cysteine protease